MRTICFIGALGFCLFGCLADDNDTAPRFFVQEGGEGTDAENEEVSDEGDQTSESTCDLPAEDEVGTGLGDTFNVLATLTDCDGNKVQLSDLMCGHSLTFIDISAGWCQPCKEQAETLDEEIYEPFKDQGLQVLSIIFEDPDGFPATSSYCQVWKDTFELTSPVLVDPQLLKLKQQFADAGNAAPVNILVDENFTIVYLFSGEKPVDLVETIEAELAK